MRRAFLVSCLACAAIVAIAITIAPRRADAFCGFYVEGSGKALYNDATQVVLMREGTRTVLSMQNHYQGPPEAFALVVPVPVVLQEADVKTLPADVFARVDLMDSPRLVEYWEQDPCAPDVWDRKDRSRAQRGSAPGAAPPNPKKADLGVTIEAQFTVGEYQIVILSAKDSTGLDTWLRQEQYAIPAGAEPMLRPYVEGGWKFFVAKVDPTKVTFEGGAAKLSPLRFHYDSDDFVLPVRLGLINSSGTQDLIVHVLARNQRYEIANLPNAFIPTNLDLKPEAADRFAEFYAALFDRTAEKHPGAVITEYAWDASTCDPCPGPTLTWNDLATLGADVIDEPARASGGGVSAGAPAVPAADRPSQPDPRMRRPSPGPRRPPPRGFVLTRLHVRYGTSLSEDLVFRAASAVVGGREVRGAGGALETGATPSGMNSFQARYAIRHEWTGPVECATPVRGRWGGPPAGEPPRPPRGAQDLAFAPRGGVQLASLVAADVPEVDVKAGGAAVPDTATKVPADAGAAVKAPPATAPKQESKQGCGCDSGADGADGALSFLVVLVGLMLITRNRRCRR